MHTGVQEAKQKVIIRKKNPNRRNKRSLRDKAKRLRHYSRMSLSQKKKKKESHGKSTKQSLPCLKKTGYCSERESKWASVCPSVDHAA